jgi:hypothetical protein
VLCGLPGGGRRGLLGVGVEHHLLQQHVQLGVAPVRGRDLADEPHPLVGRRGIGQGEGAGPPSGHLHGAREPDDVGVLGRDPQRALAHPRDQHRDRPLNRRRNVGLLGKPAPHLREHGRRVHPALVHRRERQPGVDVLVAHVTCADSQLDPAAGQ